MTCFQRLSLVVAAPVLGFCLVVSGEDVAIHECKDAKGTVVFQSEPCSEPALVVPEPLAAVKPSAKPPAKSPAKPKTRAASKAPPEAPPPPPAAAPQPAAARDSRWGTPESALRTFVAAVKAGDRALVLSCLTSSALAELGPGADALPMDTLRATVGTFTGYVSEGDVGPFWSIRALRAGTKPKWIFLERTAAGEWKIGGF